jgi:hypothetical protein
MFIVSFKTVIGAMVQIFVLGAFGFILTKRRFFSPSILEGLTRLVIEVSLPLFIFCRLIKDFSFSLYVNWWIFPLLSFGITVLGLSIGGVFIKFLNPKEVSRQFLVLVAFQNSGWLPLPLVAALLPIQKAETMFIYIFLFLLGFNLVIWSLGVYILAFDRDRAFELSSLFSPPVLAILFSLAFIYIGAAKIVPSVLFRPFKMIGDCTLPLAMFIVGGNLALMRPSRINKRLLVGVLAAKLVVLPLLGMVILYLFKVRNLIGFLILLQLAMPPATSLSIINRHYHKEDILLGQGIFFGHIFSAITITLFLSLYFNLNMLQ